MIIGFAGAKRSGKDSAAKIISDEFGDQKNIYKHSFAKNLKKSAAASLGISTSESFTAEDWANFIKEDGHIDVLWGKSGFKRISGREFLQRYGTEAHRDIFGQTFWIDAVLNKIPNPITPIGTMLGWTNRFDLITDVRFQNEAEAILNYGGKVARISRPSVEPQNPEHASEIPLSDEFVTNVIDNSKDLKHFRTNVINFVVNEVING